VRHCIARRQRSTRALAWAIGVASLASPAQASLTTFTNFASWQSQTPSYTEIGFTEFPQWTHITDQYADQGVVITAAAPPVVFFSGSFPIDNTGIYSQGAWIDFNFSEVQKSFAMFGVSSWKLDFYLGDQFLGSTGVVSNPAQLPDQTFAGGVSTTGFDRVRLVDWSPNSLSVDNFYFSTIPGPSGLAAFGVALAALGRRGRCQK
jgi:hypothetical protein